MDNMNVEPGDIIFSNVRLIDGSGGKSHTASVQVRGQHIIRVTTEQFPSSAVERARFIDGKDGKLALTPGFIDMHAHSDLSLLHTPDHLAKITQGVTTEVIGQDGIGYAPVDDKSLEMIRVQIAGWNGNPEEASFWSWRSVLEYLDHLDNSKIATNAAFLVPQGNLRMLVLGYDPREATTEEINKMKALLEVAMQQGAVGMSSGLTYVPGMYAPNSELAELLTVVQKYGGYYSPHHRSYGKGALEAYREMIDLAKDTGVRLHLTHATLNFKENKGKAPEFLEMIIKARSELGVTITLDTYPYLQGSTTLASMLPSWSAAGGPSDTLALLKDPEALKKIRYDVEVAGTDGCHGCTLDWDTVEISGVRNEKLLPLIGLTIDKITSNSELLAVLGLDPSTHPGSFDVMIEVMIQDKLSTTILQHVGHEENVRAIIKDPCHCGGSDGILVGVKPHPRGWGCFTRYLGHYVRDLPQGRIRDIYNPDSVDTFETVEPESVFVNGLEEAVAHLTSRPASVLKLSDRGLIKQGYRADLVLFDPENVRDDSTFADPRRPSKGVAFVLVNGIIAVDNGVPTLARAGKTIRLHKDGSVA